MPTTQFYTHDPQRLQYQVNRDAKVLKYLAGSQKRKVFVTAPADVTVNPNMQLQLSGTGTSADTIYDIQQITFIFEQPDASTEGDSGGAVMQIEAKTSWGDITGASNDSNMDNSLDQGVPAQDAPGDLGNLGSSDLPAGFG